MRANKYISLLTIMRFLFCYGNDSINLPKMIENGVKHMNKIGTIIPTLSIPNDF